MASGGHAVIGLVAGAIALVGGPAMVALGIAAGVGNLGGKPNWFLGGLFILAGLAGLVAGVAGVTLGWKAYRS